MNPSITQFQYDYSNLDLYQFQDDWVLVAISLVWGVVLMVLLCLMIRWMMIRYIGWEIDREITHKKKTLANLILMKDIQTELEKEIEQAILKAAFHT